MTKPHQTQTTPMPVHCTAHPLVFNSIASDRVELAKQAEAGANAAIAAASNIVFNLFKQSQAQDAKLPVSAAERLTTVAERLQTLRDKAHEPAQIPARDIDSVVTIAQRAQEKLAKGKGK